LKKNTGQILIIVIIALTVLTIGIPALIYYIQKESDWAMKEERTTRAFQLAEAGIERGYQSLILSTTSLSTVEAGGTLTSYNFDQAYTDMPGGQYSIRLAGNPIAQTVTVTSVGKDSSGKELRAIQVVYATPGAYAASIYAINSATIQGNPTVEWGPVASPGPITTDASHTYPRYFSGGDILPFDSNAGSPPNTDNLQWWSYYSMPPAPQIDLPGYKTAAGAACTDQANCLSSACTVCYYTAANYATFSPGTNNHFGTATPNPATALIVEGDLSLSGNYGNGSVSNASIPSTAWKEYANDWSHYTAMDAYASGHFATYQDAVNANYVGSGLTYGSTITKAFIYGFLYVGGTISISGGGNGSIIGSLYCATVANLGSSHVTVYYENTVISNIKVQNSSLGRTSWKEMSSCSWPTASANPTCP